MRKRIFLSCKFSILILSFCFCTHGYPFSYMYVFLTVLYLTNVEAVLLIQNHVFMSSLLIQWNCCLGDHVLWSVLFHRPVHIVYIFSMVVDSFIHSFFICIHFLLWLDHFCCDSIKNRESDICSRWQGFKSHMVWYGLSSPAAFKEWHKWMQHFDLLKWSSFLWTSSSVSLSGQ